MKILNDNAFLLLKTKAQNWDALAVAVADASDAVSADDISPDFIRDALAAAALSESDSQSLSDNLTELQSQVASLNMHIQSLSAERDALAAELDALRNLPASDSVTTKKPKAEPSAVSSDELVSFAASHKGDTIAIARRLKEEGIV